MKKYAIYLVTITLLLLSGCEKGFDYRNKWEGNYTFYRDYDGMTGCVIVKKVGDGDMMNFKFIWYDGEGRDLSCDSHVDKKGFISSCGHGVDGDHFIKRDSIVITYTNYGHGGSSQVTYYCKKTKKDYHDVVHGL